MNTINPSREYASYIHSYHIHSFFFFFNDTATTEIYTLSLHDALPIFSMPVRLEISIGSATHSPPYSAVSSFAVASHGPALRARSEEHTSELQSLAYLVCRLLLEKKKKVKRYVFITWAALVTPITSYCA